MLAPWKKNYDQPRQHIKKQRHYFTDKDSYSQNYGLSSRHVSMWELDHIESWALKNWCFWTVVLEKTWASFVLQGDQISQSSRKSIQNIHWKNWCWSWSSNTLVIWCKELTHWKRPWCSNDWRQEEKGMTEDEMIGCYHWLDVHGFEQALGAGNGQGSLAYCSPQGRRESDMTERLNWMRQLLVGVVSTLL